MRRGSRPALSRRQNDFGDSIPADFAQTNTCSSPVNPGANCSISVTFLPTATGTRTAIITIADDDGSPQTVKLDGTGK